MRLGHYMTGIWDPGGIASYIRRVGEMQRGDGHAVYYFDQRSFARPTDDEARGVIYVEDDDNLMEIAAEMKLDVLHTHMLVGAIGKRPIPILRTLHGHQPYCPSGTRYLKRWNRPCDRNYSLLGCTWGHLIDHCGSIRPQKFIADFQATWAEMETLSKITVATDSSFLKQQMVRAGYYADRIHALNMPVPEINNAEEPPRGGIPRFVFTGRITTLKGVDWLLRSVRRVNSPIHVDIIGDGPQKSEMQELAEKLSLIDKVTFHGWVSSQRVDEFLKAGRALVFPSLWHEPGGTSAFEAMMNKRAVIASRVGGMPEVVLDKINGLLIDPGDHLGLARAIELMADDWDLAQRLGNEGWRIASDKYSLRMHVDALTDLYKRCIADMGRS